jgi:hypothetical protein
MLSWWRRRTCHPCSHWKRLVLKIGKLSKTAKSQTDKS